MLLRHAKSSWADATLDDHARQLAKRGTKAALAMGHYMADEGLIPEVVLCSDAIRTRATLTLILKAWQSHGKRAVAAVSAASSTSATKAASAALPLPRAIITNALYLAAPEAILDVIADQAGSAARVLVIGHNPGLHALALSLPSNGRRADLASLAMKFPTAALAEITFERADWSDLRPASGHLRRFIVPRALTPNHAP